jgi:two-component system response regulator DesR
MVIRVLITKDSYYRGSEVRALLCGQPDINLIGELPFGQELAGAALALLPDVIIVDTELMVSQVLPVTADLQSRLPSCSVLVLCDPAEPGMLPPRRQGSHVSFLMKDAASAYLIDTVHRLAAGERIVHPRLWLASLNTARDFNTRELEVLGLAAEGDTVADIAKRLNLSGGTVRNYLSKVIAKTGARNRIDAIRIVRKSGWLR